MFRVISIRNDTLRSFSYYQLYMWSINDYEWSARLEFRIIAQRRYGTFRWVEFPKQWQLYHRQWHRRDYAPQKIWNKWESMNNALAPSILLFSEHHVTYTCADHQCESMCCTKSTSIFPMVYRSIMVDFSCKLFVNHWRRFVYDSHTIGKLQRAF